MPLPASVVPVVSRSHIAVLEYLCDDQARRRPALGHIFAALRPEITRLGEISKAAPVPEVVTDCLPVPEPLLYHCKHGSQPGYVSPRLIGPLIRDDNGRGTMVWTPEHGVTFFLRHFQSEADVSYDYAFRKFRTSTCVILPQKPVCVQCDRDYRDTKRAVASKAKKLTQPQIDRRPMAKPDVPLPGDISFLPLSLEQCEAAKAKRVMLPGLRNGRPIRVREAWEISASNAKWTAKNNRKLAARGWIGYSPEDFDRTILHEREKRGAVELEAITKFDRDLSRKGNK